MISVGKTSAEASGKKVYSFVSADCTKFTKSGNILKIKIVNDRPYSGGLLLNSVEIYKQKLSLKLASDCKWSKSFVDDETAYQSWNYKEIKKEIKSSRSYYEENGDVDSPGKIQIIVKNGKVKRVNVVFS